MKTLKMKGYCVLLDEEDYDRVCEHRWHPLLSLTANSKRTYCMSSHPRMYMHRFILDAPKGLMVDHINGNGLDNRKCNLRLCTQSQNLANQKKLRPSLSGYKGVYVRLRKNGTCRWKACIRWKGKMRFLGGYETADEAAIAYNVAAQLFFGPFACLNAV